MNELRTRWPARFGLKIEGRSCNPQSGHSKTPEYLLRLLCLLYRTRPPGTLGLKEKIRKTIMNTAWRVLYVRDLYFRHCFD